MGGGICVIWRKSMLLVDICTKANNFGRFAVSKKAEGISCRFYVIDQGSQLHSQMFVGRTILAVEHDRRQRESCSALRTLA